ncbi:hypothetical protein B0H17DRAFT_1134298 [Mycena rosella]|uniref:Uncharacterized protein n=1 Tax=Mycena rosella TaxID=1033263 RepID=A0AAD7DFZ6_MYCRO|nr:hypothetical protein B0H17DRAFT_1134298 [Mycena rosella]
MAALNLSSPPTSFVKRSMQSLGTQEVFDLLIVDIFPRGTYPPNKASLSQRLARPSVCQTPAIDHDTRCVQRVPFTRSACFGANPQHQRWRARIIRLGVGRQYCRVDPVDPVVAEACSLVDQWRSRVQINFHDPEIAHPLHRPALRIESLQTPIEPVNYYHLPQSNDLPFRNPALFHILQWCARVTTSSSKCVPKVFEIPQQGHIHLSEVDDARRHVQIGASAASISSDLVSRPWAGRM